MTEDMLALARRAVACKGWRWMPGMVAIHPDVSVSRVLFGRGYSFVGAYRRELKTKSPSWWQGWSGQVQHSQYGYAGFEHCTPIPDLTDPATLGCLLALVREAREDVTLGVIRQDLGIMQSKEAWFIIGEGGDDGKWAHTEAEALVAALEDAP